MPIVRSHVFCIAFTGSWRHKYRNRVRPELSVRFFKWNRWWPYLNSSQHYPQHVFCEVGNCHYCSCAWGLAARFHEVFFMWNIVSNVNFNFETEILWRHNWCNGYKVTWAILVAWKNWGGGGVGPPPPPLRNRPFLCLSTFCFCCFFQSQFVADTFWSTIIAETN